MIRFRNKSKVFLHVNRDTGIWLALVLLTLPHISPPYLERIPAWESVLDVYKIASFLIITFWLLLFKRKISLAVVLVGVWEAFMFITTLLHQGGVYSAATTAFSVLSIVLLYDVAYSEGGTFLSSQLFCFEVVIYINLLTEILYPRALFPQGMYLNSTFPQGPNWFLGYYNGYTKYCIPALMFAWLYKEKTGHKARAYFLLFGIILSAILVFAGGFAVSLVSMIVVYVFLKNKTKVFHYFSYWALHIAFFIGIIVLKVQNLFNWLIEGILGKQASFEARTQLWDKTMQLIAESPLIGHGIQSGVTRIAEYHLYFGIHAHNMFLEMLYRGGLIGVAIWIVLVVAAGINVYKNRNTIESKIISTAFLGWCLTTLIEPFTTPFFVGMFIIAYHSNRVTLADSQPVIPAKQRGARLAVGRYYK